jgi:hypothetical protein
MVRRGKRAMLVDQRSPQPLVRGETEKINFSIGQIGQTKIFKQNLNRK